MADPSKRLKVWSPAMGMAVLLSTILDTVPPADASDASGASHQPALPAEVSAGKATESPASPGAEPAPNLTKVPPSGDGVARSTTEESLPPFEITTRASCWSSSFCGYAMKTMPSGPCAGRERALHQPQSIALRGAGGRAHPGPVAGLEDRRAARRARHRVRPVRRARAHGRAERRRRRVAEDSVEDAALAAVGRAHEEGRAAAALGRREERELAVGVGDGRGVVRHEQRRERRRPGRRSRQSRSSKGGARQQQRRKRADHGARRAGRGGAAARPSRGLSDRPEQNRARSCARGLSIRDLTVVAKTPSTCSSSLAADSEAARLLPAPARSVTALRSGLGG